MIDLGLRLPRVDPAGSTAGSPDALQVAAAGPPIAASAGAMAHHLDAAGELLGDGGEVYKEVIVTRFPRDGSAFLIDIAELYLFPQPWARTGRWAKPRAMLFSARTGSPASSRRWTRAASAVKMAIASSRARPWPAQAWMP